MTKKQVKSFLTEKPGYAKYSFSKIAEMLKSDRNTVQTVIHEINNTPKSEKYVKIVNPLSAIRRTEGNEYQEFLAWKNRQENTSKELDKPKAPKPFTTGDKKNVLIIGDLHSPFTIDGYLDFCREQQEKYNCGTVIFIGDIVDGHSWSYHEADPNGKGQNEEINEAKEELSRWFYTFPNAKCTLGNHDLLISRKAKTHGLSSQFIRSFNEIWGAPKGWEFGYEFIIDNVRYTHGDFGTAMKISKESRISTVQGHLHTEAYVHWSVSEKDRIFGLQVGCGIDHKKYAFEYAKPLAKKPVIACAVILESGTVPITLPMNL